MPNPGDHIPAPEVGRVAVKLVDPVACGNEHPWVPGDRSWSRTFRQCRCAGRGHWVWRHACGWELTAPPHQEDHWDEPYV